MFVHENLQNHLDSSSTVRVNSKVIAEWNMNIPNNILQVGNYRYRPSAAAGTDYNPPMQSFDLDDAGRHYTDATSSDIVIDGGLDNDDLPTVFVKDQEKERQLFSLEDCFGKNRPRSGINKLRFFRDKYTHFANSQMASRPRYYVASRDDKFKYWTSYRKENGVERGISNSIKNELSHIDDAAPYVVYKDPVPSNRIVVKMQTNVGDVDLGPFFKSGYSIADPFYGLDNATTPLRWKIQYLSNNTWVDAVSFQENSTRLDGSPIVGADGFVELSYGPLIPDAYKSIFNFVGDIPSYDFLPVASSVPDGYAYFVPKTELQPDMIYISVDSGWVGITATYGWSLADYSESQATPYVTELVDTPSIVNPSSGDVMYKEFQYISGLRVIAEAMNGYDQTFDLIELSPRLSVDLSSKTESFSVTKNASDLGVSGLPVSQLLASTGSLSLFDYDQAFFANNTNSIINKYLSQRAQFRLSEIIKDVQGEDVHVPIKTMYSESFPESKSVDRSVSINLRDLFYYFEEQTAPQILAPGVTTSYAISLLLDSIGFSNYTFYSAEGEAELEIPFFFVQPDRSVAEVLNDIAISTQSAMFFDEFNNLSIMSKGYMLPDESVRPTDTILRGTKDFSQSGELQNKAASSSISNIENIASQQRNVYNDGVVSYTSRYIQRSFGSIKQANMLDRDKTWIYKPALLWEVAPTEQTKPINDEVSSQSAYVLGAIPLNSSLTSSIPEVKNNKVINNVMDLGDGIYWITRYNGYFYANGEIIKYDAVQFSIPGLSAVTDDPNVVGDNVWISSVQEYSRYFAKLPFNGKMYPTGLVRIYSEPNLEMIEGSTFFSNGPVAKHGRGQFNTEIVEHQAGLSEHWSSNDNVRGCKMDFIYLSSSDMDLPETEIGPAGLNNDRAKDTTRVGTIKNFLASSFIEENEEDSRYPATVQSSAFVFNGSSFAFSDNPLEHVSYVYKPLENRFTHFGSRMRIIGKVENSQIRGQSPVGSFTYYTPSETSSEQPSAVAGASGGIAVCLNPETNVGYYFELVALTDSNLEQYSDTSVNNIMFYKIKKNAAGEDVDKAIPIPLWQGIGQVLVDDGKFTGQSRMSTTETNTVYDIGVEYKDIGSTRRFYLYINNVMIAIVDDSDPLPVYNNMALFVRGSSECMFENVYALADTQHTSSDGSETTSSNYSTNKEFTVLDLENKDSYITKDNAAIGAFGIDEVSANDSFQKYALSGMIKSTYLSGLGPSGPPKYGIYFEEFGTIMREAAYFNVRYDKAYPALYAALSPTFNRIKGYTVSNFFASSYGAEFMVFNATDSALTLDSTSGNYLRIQGVTFTQESVNELTVDDYFNTKTDESSLKLQSGNVAYSTVKSKDDYFDIRQSRLEHGNQAFSVNAPYIQSHDAAEGLMGWMVNKIMKPSRSVGVEIFANPILQLGDIVQIDYKNSEGLDEIAPYDSRFVVYSIEYKRDPSGPSMVAYLSEVS